MDKVKNVEASLEQIEDALESGSRFAISNKLIIDAEPIKQAIVDIRLNLPAELSQARAIIADRNGLIARAKDDAVTIKTEAESERRELWASAKKKVEEYVEGANDYIRKMIGEAESHATGTVETANKDASIIVANANLEAQALVENSAVVRASKETADEILAKAKAEAEAILSKANAEAESTLAAARQNAATLEADARESFDTAIEKSKKWSAEIRSSAIEFVEDIMAKADSSISESLNSIRSTRASIKSISGVDSESTEQQ